MANGVSRIFRSLGAGLQGILASTALSMPPDADSSSTEDIPEYAAPTRPDSIGRIVAPVMINGQGPFRLIVDTGASHSSITEEAALRLGYVLTESSTALLNGVTGSAMVPMLDAQRLQSGDLIVENPRIAVIGTSMLAGADGVLGLAGTLSKRLSVDFRRDRVTITQSRRVSSDMFMRIPVQRLPGGILSVSAKVRTLRAQAIIDTGASHSFGNLALCEELEQRRGSKSSAPVPVFGATPDVSFGRNQRIRAIQLGPDVRLEDVNLVCGDFHIFKVWNLQSAPALVIGMDVLGGVESLVIDFARQEVHIRPRRSALSDLPMRRR